MRDRVVLVRQDDVTDVPVIHPVRIALLRAIEETLIDRGDDGAIGCAGDSRAKADVAVAEEEPAFPRGQLTAREIHRRDTEFAVAYAADEARLSLHADRGFFDVERS